MIERGNKKVFKNLVFVLSSVVFGASLPFIVSATTNNSESTNDNRSEEVSTKTSHSNPSGDDKPSLTYLDNAVLDENGEPIPPSYYSEYSETSVIKDDENERISNTYNSITGISTIAVYNKNNDILESHEILPDGTKRNFFHIENLNGDGEMVIERLDDPS